MTIKGPSVLYTVSALCGLPTPLLHQDIPTSEKGQETGAVPCRTEQTSFRPIFALIVYLLLPAALLLLIGGNTLSSCRG